MKSRHDSIRLSAVSGLPFSYFKQWISNPFSQRVSSIITEARSKWNTLVDELFLQDYFVESFAERAKEDRQYHQFCHLNSVLKQEARLLLKIITKKKIDLRILRKIVLRSQHNLQQNIISPFQYDQQYQKIIKSLHRRQIPQSIRDVFREARTRLHEKLLKSPEDAISYFYDDLLNHIIKLSEGDIKPSLLFALVKYYKDLVPEEIYCKIYEIVKSFIHIINVVNVTQQNYYLILDKELQAFVKQINNIFANYSESKLQKISPVNINNKSKQENHIFNNTLATCIKFLRYSKENPLKVIIGSMALHATASATWQYFINNSNASVNLCNFTATVQPLYGSSLIPLLTQPAYTIAKFSISYSLLKGDSFLPISWAIGLSLLTEELVVPATYAFNLDNETSSSFLKAISGGTNEAVNVMTKTSDGCFVIGGSLHTLTVYPKAMVAKYYPNGTNVWAYSFGEEYDNTVEVQAVVETSDKNIVTLGIANFGFKNSDITLTALSPNGTLIKFYTLGRSGSEVTASTAFLCDEGYAISEMQDKSLILTGKMGGCTSGNNRKFLVAKIFSNWSLDWVLTLTNGGYYDGGYAITSTADGGIVTVGMMGRYESTISILKFSANKNLLWARTLSSYTNSERLSVVETSVGDIVVAGNFHQNGQILILLSKYSANGTYLSTQALQSIQSYGSTETHVTSLFQNAKSELLLSGYVYNSYSGADALIFKINTNYTLAWSKKLGESNGDDRSYGIVEMQDGTIAATGNTASFGMSNKNVFIAKFDYNDNLTNCSTLRDIQLSLTENSVNNTDITSDLIVTDETSNYKLQQKNQTSLRPISFRELLECGFNSNNINNTTEASFPPFMQTMGDRWNDVGYSIIHTTDNGKVIVGATQGINRNPDNTDALITKLSFNNTVEWTRVIGGPKVEEGRAIIELNDNSFIALINTNSFREEFYGSEYDVLLAKLHNNGTLAGLLQIVGGNEDEQGYSLVKTADSGFALAGIIKAQNIIIKFFDDLSFAWGRKLSVSTSPNNSVCSMVATSDGGVIVAGKNGVITRFSAAGLQRWSRGFGGAGYAAITTRNNHIIVAGATNNYGYSDALVAKFTESGNVIWGRTIGGDGIDFAKAVIETDDNNLIIAGHTGYSFSNNYNIFVTKLSSDGDLIWSRILGGDKDAFGFGLTKLRNGHFAVVGKIINSEEGYSDILLAELDANGNINNCTDIQTIYPKINPIYINPEVSTNDGAEAITYAVLKINATTDYAPDIILNPNYACSRDKQFRNIQPNKIGLGDSVVNAQAIDTTNSVTCKQQLRNEVGSLTFFRLIRTKIFGTYNYGGGLTHAKTVDGGFVIGGYTGDKIGKFDAFVTKLSPHTFSPIWARSFGENGFEKVNAIFEDRNGNILAVGSTDSFSMNENTFIAKINATNGKLLWVRRLSQYQLRGINQGCGISQLNNDDYILVAGMQGNSDGTLLIRFTTNGSLIGVRYLNYQFNINSYAIAVNADDSFVIAGHTFTDNLSEDCFIAKFISENELSWIKALGNIDNEYCNAIALTKNDDILLFGSSLRMGYGVNFFSANVALTDGQLKWAYTFGLKEDRGNAITIVSEREFVITGRRDDANVYIAKMLIDNGMPIWEREFGRGYSEEGYAVTGNTGENTFFTGRSTDKGATSSAISIAQISNDGNIANCSAIHITNSTFIIPNITLTDLTSRVTIYDVASNYTWMNWDNISIQDTEFDIAPACFVDITQNNTQITTGGNGRTYYIQVISGRGTDILYSASKTSDGGFIVVGGGREVNGVLENLIMKFSFNGNLAWKKILDRTIIHSVIEASDGNIIAAGKSYVNYLTNDIGGGSIYKFTPSGRLLWTRLVRGENSITGVIEKANGNLLALSSNQIIEFTKDGEFNFAIQQKIKAMLKVIKSFDNNLIVAGSDFLHKISSNGNLIWGTQLDEGGNGIAIVETFDKGYVTACNGLAIKYNTNGLLVWSRALSFRELSFGYGNYALIEAANKDLIIVGSAERSSDNLGYRPKVLVIRLTATGSFVWARQIGKLTSNELGYAVLETDNEDIMIVGSIWNEEIQGTLLVRLNKNGEIPGCDLVKELYPTIIIPDISVAPFNPTILPKMPEILDVTINTVQNNSLQTYLCGIPITTSIPTNDVKNENNNFNYLWIALTAGVGLSLGLAVIAIYLCQKNRASQKVAYMEMSNFNPDNKHFLNTNLEFSSHIVDSVAVNNELTQPETVEEGGNDNIAQINQEANSLIDSHPTFFKKTSSTKGPLLNWNLPERLRNTLRK